MQKDHKIAFALLLIFTILVYLRPQDHFTFLVPLRLPLFTSVSALILLFFSSSQKQIMGFVSGREIKTFFLLTIVVLIAIPFSVWPGGTTRFVYETYIRLIILYFLIVTTVNSINRLKVLIGLVVILSVFLALDAAYKYIIGDFTRGRVYGMGSGLFSDPNDLALGLVMAMPFSFYICVSQRKVWKKFIFGALFFIILYATITTYSRAGFLGIIVVGSLIFWDLLKRKKTIILMVVMSCIFIVYAIAPPGYTDRIYTIFYTDEDRTGSAQERLFILETGWEAFKQRPLLGAGLSSFEVMYYEISKESGGWKASHNTYLQVLVETGILGFSLFILLIYYGFNNLNIVRKTLVKNGSDVENLSFYAEAARVSFCGFLIVAFFLSQAWTLHLYYLLGYTKTMERLASEKISLKNVK